MPGRDPVRRRCVRSVAATLRRCQSGERLVRVRPERCHRHHAAQLQPLRLRDLAANAGTSSGSRHRGHPGRGLRGPYAARLTCSRQRSVFPSSTAARDNAFTSDDRSTECTTAAHRTTERALFDCNCPTKCQVTSGQSGAFDLQLLLAVLADVVHAERRQSPYVADREGFGDRDQGHLVLDPPSGLTGRLDPLPRLLAGSPAARPRASRRRSRGQPDEAGHPAARRALAPVRVQVLRLDRAAVASTTAHPSSFSCAFTPAATSSDGVPQLVSEYDAGTRSATSARISAGTS